MATTKEIIDYVMESPHNTNPSVLKSLLNEHSTSGSSGGGGGTFIINSAYDETADGIKMDHTWQEIADATLSGKQCMLVSYDSGYDPPALQYIHTSLDIQGGTSSGNWSIIVYDIKNYAANKYLSYTTDSADGYPVYYPD